MIIRQEQMSILSQDILKRFIDRMSAQLRGAFPRESSEIAEPELHARIQEAIERAESYGVTDEADVERYLEFMVRYGPRFDTDQETAWASEVLRRDDLSGAEKMNALDDYELFESRML